jgi:hypothetical protein
MLLLMILIDKAWGSVLSDNPLALSCAGVRNVCFFLIPFPRLQFPVTALREIKIMSSVDNVNVLRLQEVAYVDGMCYGQYMCTAP